MEAGLLKINRIVSQIASISERFANLAGRVLKVLTFSPFEEGLLQKRILALSIEKGAVSAVYGVRLLHGIKVRSQWSFSYDGERLPTPEELSSSASAVFSQIKERRGVGVNLIIPKSLAVLKIAEFPVTVKENLHNVVSFEMDRVTPFNPEDVFYDYRIIKEDGGRLSILIAAARKDIVNSYTDALREKGITVERVTINLSAMAALSFYSGRKDKTIFLDIMKDSYEAGLFERSVVIDHISGGLEEEDEKKRVDTILSHLQPLLDRLKSAGTVPEILLLSRDSSARELLKSRINYPFRILGETDLRLKLPATKDIPYIALGGLVESLNYSKEGINLLSSGKREKEKIPISLTIVLSIAILALAAVYFITPLRMEERRLRAIDDQIAQKKAEARKVELLKKEVEDLREEIASIDNFKGDRTSSLAILKEMTLILPKNTWLTRFRITEVDVNIEGYASSATELLPKLEASRYFRKAEFSSPTFRDARMNADRFIIKMEIETAKKPEVKKPEVKIEKK